MQRLYDSEATVEAHLRKLVKEMGGRAYKFVSPGAVGVPDRILAMPGGIVIFVECKGRGGSFTPMQALRLRELDALQQPVATVWSKTDVDELLDGWRRNGTDCQGLRQDLAGLQFWRR